MKRLTITIIGHVLLCIVTVSCDHVFMTKDELAWFNAWEKIDTLYYYDCDNKLIDTLTTRMLNIWQPVTTNLLNLNPDQFNIGNDSGTAELLYYICHNGKRIRIHSKMYVLDDYEKRFLYVFVSTDLLEYKHIRIEHFDDISSKLSRLKIEVGECPPQMSMDNDVIVDYLEIDKDSALVSYSVNGHIYKRM